MKSIYKKFVSLGDGFLQGIDEPSLDSEISVLYSITIPRSFWGRILFGFIIIVIIFSIYHLRKNTSINLKDLGYLFVVYTIFFIVFIIIGYICIFYVIDQKRDEEKWVAVLAWIFFLIVGLSLILCSFWMTFVSSNLLYFVIGVSVIMGIISGIGILCWIPGKGVIAWFGFLSGIGADSITAPGIIKWLSQNISSVVDSVINPLLSNSLQLTSEHINLGVGIYMIILILLSMPALVIKED